MKKKLIALLLVLTMLSQTLQLGLATGSTGDPVTLTEESPAPQGEENLGNEIPSPPVNPIDLIGTEDIEWMFYEEFLYSETEYAWDNPDSLIGATASFNLDLFSEFVFASDTSVAFDEYNYGDEGYAVLLSSELIGEDGKSLCVTVTDYLINKTDDTTGDFWLKIEAAEGYTLPETIKNYPYVLHAAYQTDIPSLLMVPQMGVFTNDVITVHDSMDMASHTIDIDASLFPGIFEVDTDKFEYDDFGNLWYDLGDITHIEGVDDPNFRYIPEESLTFVPTAVSRVYNALVSADGTIQFNNILNNVPAELVSKIPLGLKDEIIDYSEELIRLENIEKTATVTYNGIPLNVTVKGKIPETGVTLVVTPLQTAELFGEGFKFDEGEKVITALDIKIINDLDGTEWQPEKNYPVEVSIEMTPLGVGEGRIVTLRHKHEDEINTNDVFVVMDGKLTAVTNGFSIYVVSDVPSDERIGDTIGNNSTISLEVGDEVVYYFSSNNDNGTWRVTDTSGAIHYTVHANVTSSAAIGYNQVKARWIKIVALKATTTPITLEYNTGNNNPEKYSLNITAPKADAGEKLLYIRDVVNTTGRIEAAVVDENGNEVSLEGAAFSWTRDDGLFIVPQAYDLDYRGVNIARDHGGIVESRVKKDSQGKQIGYQPTTYTLKVILADGTELEDSYTVYYQSEIVNAGFEFPDSNDRNYSFFPNGYPELYWKTTAPGTGTGNITKDIEYGDVTGNTEAADYTVNHAADYKTGGAQFAELNAEAFGALYQDIITAPEEDIVWNFAHAARYPSWATVGGNIWGQGGTNDTSNKMYIVIGPTEAAQKLTTQKQLETLGQLAKDAGGNAFLEGEISVDVEYQGAKYKVWYHNADDDDGDNDGGWFTLNGEYTVPEGQYRTRLFFVSDKGSSTHPNAGNLIDISKAGQYKSCLIEYYEETYVNGKLQLEFFGSKTEDKMALVYSSLPLDNFDYFETEQNDYLHKIVINGKNYPYDIRYADRASLYIEKYPVDEDNLKVPDIDVYEKDKNGNIITNKNYADYDIVMQIYFRDTVVAVQKELVLPTKTATTPGMTEEQKLNLLAELNANGGYRTDFILTSDNEAFVQEQGTTYITNRDPAGRYKAYIALGNNPPLGNNYFIEEVRPQDPKGLVLSRVEFSVYRYSMGATIEDKPVLVSYDVLEADIHDKLITKGIYFGDVIVDDKKVSVKIADVTVTNYYEEKETTIVYHAVGNGKIKSNKKGSVFEDTPTETLKYYSGKSDGCSAHFGVGSTFVGWYKDPACTDEVTSADGVYDKTTGSFYPNANIIDAEEVHFYAKFDTCNVVIERENGEPGKTFVYEVTGPAKTGGGTITTYVTVTCGADGKGSTTIYEATKGQYTVKELDGWSWRYTGETQKKTHPADELSMTFKFTSKPSEQWLDGFSTPEKNVHGKAKVTS